MTSNELIATVALEEVRFYAYHGVLPQERTLGNTFIVTAQVEYNIARAAQSDAVEDTLNYAALYQVIQGEMQTPSHLLEHLAARICSAVRTAFPAALACTVKITKAQVPIPALMKGASVTLSVRYR